MPVAQGPVVVAGINLIKPFGILHSSVYTFFEKMSVIELNADVETGNWKFEIRQRIYIFVFSPISSFKFYCQNTRTTKCKLFLTCREGCQPFVYEFLPQRAVRCAGDGAALSGGHFRTGKKKA
jgi:hypothetical protein